MTRSTLSVRLSAGITAAALAAAGVLSFSTLPAGDAGASDAPAAPAATEVGVATLARRDTPSWTVFSGRLEAVEQVEVRSRVAGPIQQIHFREGALVKAGDRLVTIDPAPYAAEVERARAGVAAAEARLTLARADLERGRRMTALSTISQRDLDTRVNALGEAEANLAGAKAALTTAELNLSYTEVRAPVAGRVDRIEITVGNLVAAGPGAPVLTRLTSVDPIYASFDADELAVSRALDSLDDGGDRRERIGDIPVEMTLQAREDQVRGRLQLVGSTVDARTGTIRVRATFANADGRLMPGQFARMKLGQAKTRPALLLSERAVGVDQDKSFVFVVDSENRATYREVTLGASVGALRVVESGLEPGERVVIDGAQKLRPGALVDPRPAAMDAVASVGRQASASE
ncbi:efflux RND transporter periplasmic adaptor subunit [Methylopila henanensis]|uniref:Efflux RND transporter periplasmic adaptor subunit n=1 Tax=Methylopila henanensis TaxID=873516 RepID=A0ABW4K8D0_9HYPH